QVQFSCGHRLDSEQPSAHDAKRGTSRSGICLPDRKVSSHAHVSARCEMPSDGLILETAERQRGSTVKRARYAEWWADVPVNDGSFVNGALTQPSQVVLA